MSIPQAKSAEQINHIPMPIPTEADDGKALVYNHATESHIYDSPSASVDAADVSIADTGGHFTAADVEGALSELFTSVSDGKTEIATAITGKGGTASGSDTFSVLAGAIDELEVGGAPSVPGAEISFDITPDEMDTEIFAIPEISYEITIP